MPRAKPAAPKWRRCPEDRPHQIIKAALEVFGECGLANARLQDIAERGGVSNGTIYLYFLHQERALARNNPPHRRPRDRAGRESRCSRDAGKPAPGVHERLLGVRSL